MRNFLYKFFFSRPDSLGRIFWPSKKEIEYFKNNWRNFLKSKAFYLGILLFFVFLISDFLIKHSIPENSYYRISPGFYFTNLYHRVSKITSLFAILFLIRILCFLRFKIFWRTNKFLEIGFGILLGAILSRIRDFSQSRDWLGIGNFVFNLIDIFYILGLAFLIIGAIICPKRKFNY